MYRSKWFLLPDKPQLKSNQMPINEEIICSDQINHFQLIDPNFQFPPIINPINDHFQIVHHWTVTYCSWGWFYDLLLFVSMKYYSSIIAVNLSISEVIIDPIKTPTVIGELSQVSFSSKKKIGVDVSDLASQTGWDIW